MIDRVWRPTASSATPWWDRALAIAVAIALAIEAWHRPSASAAQIAICAAGAAALWIRRPHPLSATLLGFGVATAGTLVDLLRGAPPDTLGAGVALLLLPYTLTRWGTRRDITCGAPLIATALGAAALHAELPTAIDAIAAVIVLLFPAALGTSVRFWAIARDRTIEQARLREREQLARELHDSVAHHVTAIAIQAQAGRAVLASRPELARQTLEAIEREAASTLGELRAMVGALRDERAVLHAPGRVADLRQLAAPSASPAIDVDLSDGLDDLEPAVEAAVFRLAQESITNALRHARHATRVRVRVESAPDEVRLDIRDDGQAAAWPRATSGYGLVGMAERAALLGGTFRAGPADGGGWRVEAHLPRSRAP